MTPASPTFTTVARYLMGDPRLGWREMAAMPERAKIVRYRLRQWGIVRAQKGVKAVPMMDPARIPAVAQPAAEECCCCWYQTHYGPLPRPQHLMGWAARPLQHLLRRAFPPIKPERIDGICEAHIDLLYPRKRREPAGAARQETPGEGRAAEPAQQEAVA